MADTTDNSGAENQEVEETVENTNETVEEADNDEAKTNEEEKLFTQKDLDDKLKSRLDREKSKYTQLEAEYNTMKEKAGDINALKASFDELVNEKNELVKNNDKLSNDFLKYKVAFEKGLNSDGFGLLSGSTEEELMDAADRITRLSGSQKSIPSKDYDGANAGSATKDFYREMLKGI